MLAAFVAPTLILLGALLTDIQSRKILNKWVLISIALALANAYFFFGNEGLQQGAIAAGLALAMTLPLVLLGALGAGDMKIMFAFALTSTYPNVFAVIAFSFLWATIIGLFIAMKSGNLKTLILNTFKIATLKKTDSTTLTTLPYSVALMLGWITVLILGYIRGFAI